jgi:hypothetical protein
VTVMMPVFEEATPTLLIDNFASTTAVSNGEEANAPMQSTTSFYSLISLSGMTKTPVPVSDFVGKSFSALANVQAVLAGESADVLHVWVMIDEWTPEIRKRVYSIQKAIMKQLDGLHFDFYVIDLLPGTSPEEMVSDIPVIFKRAEQESTSSNCSK